MRQKDLGIIQSEIFSSHSAYYLVLFALRATGFLLEFSFSKSLCPLLFSVKNLSKIV